MLDAVGRHRRFELTATPFGMPLYASEGFAPYKPILVLQGEVSRAPPADDRVPVRLAREDEWPAVWALDQRAGHGRPRHALLEELAKLGQVYVHDGADGQIDGFAVHSRAGGTVHIGPVVADDDDDAIACALVAPGLRAGTQVWLDTPHEIDHPLAQLLLDAGLTKLDVPALHCVHMVRGEPPRDVPGAHIYALSGLAMG